MPADFQEFQRDFARYLRQPRAQARPAGIPARPAAVYRELVFNNLCGFLDACFPVCRELLGERAWRQLNRRFFRDWPLHTPWFREIPAEFVRYLLETEATSRRPRWFAALAHYEWVELAVDTLETAKMPKLSPNGLLDTPNPLNPTLQLLAYAWPVQRISPSWRPRKAQETHLAVYRDSDDVVRFCELSPLTSRLLALMSEPGSTARLAIAQLAHEISHPDPAQLLAQAHQQLLSLQAQGILCGENP